VGKGARLAGIARAGVGGGSSRQSHQPATACFVGGGALRRSR
jgi:hypothetical protein